MRDFIRYECSALDKRILDDCLSNPLRSQMFCHPLLCLDR